VTIPILISAVALVLSFLGYRLSIQVRNDSLRPILIPVRLRDMPDASTQIFVSNFGYPIAEEWIHSTQQFSLGVRNIGSGPAINVRVVSFMVDGGQEIGREWSDPGHLASGSTIPLLVRFAHAEDYEHDLVAHRLSLEYEDLSGRRYWLHLRLWFASREPLAEAQVLQYSTEHNPGWSSFEGVVWRHAELTGMHSRESLEQHLAENRTD